MSESEKEYLLRTSATTQFDHVVTQIAQANKSLKPKQLTEIAQMNNTLREAIRAQTVMDRWDSEGNASHILNNKPTYKESLLDAYMLFQKYRSVFVDIQNQYPTPMRCLLSHERIIFNMLSSTVLEHFLGKYTHELTIGEYLLKYADDAIFYFEELNKKYISEGESEGKSESKGRSRSRSGSNNGFIPEKNLTARVEPPEITQLDHDYIAFFNKVFEHTGDTLLPPPPQKGWFDFWTQPEIVIPGLITIDEFHTLCREVFGSYYNHDQSLEDIRRLYERELNYYHPEIIKDKVLALGIPRLFAQYYGKAIENIRKTQTNFNTLILFKEHERAELIRTAPKRERLRIEEFQLTQARLEAANRKKYETLERQQSKRQRSESYKSSGGSKKYVSRRKYKRTSIKTL
jgi:hypothetical protein